MMPSFLRASKFCGSTQMLYPRFQDLDVQAGGSARVKTSDQVLYKFASAMLNAVLGND